MPPLYPKMRERPLEFRINYEAPLAEGLVFAGLGGRGCVGSMVFPDSSLYANHGTLTNMDAATDWVWIPEIGEFGLEFSGGQRVTTTFYSSLLDFTASAFFLATGRDSTPYDRIYCKNYATGFWMGRVGAANRWGGGCFNVHDKYVTLTDGIWHHLALVRSGIHHWNVGDGGRVVSAIMTNSGAPLNSDRPLYIGQENYSLNRAYFRGQLARLLLHSRALTPSEIAALADPSNVDLRVGGVPLILPPRRRFFASVEIPAPTFNPAWAQHVNSYVGLGR